MNARSSASPFLCVCASVLFLFGMSSPLRAEVETASGQVSRHPLELRVLTDPKGVHQDLPALVQNATTAKDFKELALLRLAKSSACRVIADWPCQSNAAGRARAAAETGMLPELQAPGFILESHGRMAMLDFSRSGRLLNEAEKIFNAHPLVE